MSALPARSLVVTLTFLLAVAAAPVASAQQQPAPETKPAETTAAPAKATPAPAEATPAAGETTPAPAATAPTTPTPEPEGFSIAEVTLRTEGTRKALKELEEQLEVPTDVDQAERLMYRRVLSIQDARRQTRDRLASGTLAEKGLVDLDREWQLRQKEIASWAETLRQYGSEIDSVLAKLDALSKPWKATRERASEAETQAVVERVDAMLADVAGVEDLARTRLTELIDFQDRTSAMSGVVNDSLDAVTSAIEESRQRVFEADGVPLWQVPDHDDPRQAWQRVREQFARDWGALTTYFSERRDRAIAHLSLIFLTLVVTAFLGGRLRTWAKDEPQLAETASVLRDPFSVAVLVGIASSRLFYPLAPALLTELMGMLLLIPALTLVPRIVNRPLRPIIFALAFLYLASELRNTLDAAPILHRGLQFVELLAALVFLLWLMRPARLAKLEHPEQLPTWLSPLIRLALATVIVSLVAAALGYSVFAGILGQGLLIAAYSAALLYAVYRVLSALLLAFLHTGLARRMRAVRVGEVRIHDFTCRLLRLAGLLWWAEIALRAYGIEGAAGEILTAAIGSHLTIGSVTISVGDVLLFSGVVVGSFFLSRFVRFILEEDVFPRVVLRRGVSNAISTTVHYSILMGGLLLAVAAAGMDLSRVTLLAGAFGVGIGFGLQNIVNNFVSGLILLFERPIQVGDTIEASMVRR
jgi:small-conductance mechanosensitive channel